MSDRAIGDAWVFHAGALGDFVLTWPLLRALSAMGRTVHVVADSEKARLVASHLRAGSAGAGKIIPHDAQGREFSRLWTGDAAPHADSRPDAVLVINFIADPETEPGARWHHAARTMFPGAVLAYAGPPGSASRAYLWAEHDVERLGRVRRCDNPGGTIVCHVGAGSNDKRWPLDRWARLIGRLRVRQPTVSPVVPIAGEVEAERFTANERATFGALRGRILESLDELASLVSGARLFIGADSGPTHLAAQLGVATLALFGPTDPAIWSPRGPRVRVLSPVRPAPMTWLGADDVSREADALAS